MMLFFFSHRIVQAAQKQHYLLYRGMRYALCGNRLDKAAESFVHFLRHKPGSRRPTEMPYTWHMNCLLCQVCGLLQWLLPGFKELPTIS